MPAEADLLCEYYISSSLNKKSPNMPKTISASSVMTKLNQAKQNGSTANSSLSTSTFTSSSTALLESIDFVKYEKNPMDYLKSKYRLLNTPTLSSTLNLTPKETSPMKNGNSENGTASKELASPNKTSLELNWSKIKKNGIGLLNLGNNCYLNATLQCLAYTPPLSQWLVSKPHSPSCRFKQIKGFCSMCEVEKIICDIFSSCNGVAKPNSLCFNIKKISNVFSVGRQEDASEFFTTLLESMSKSMAFANGLGQQQNGHSKPKKLLANNKRSTTILDEIFSFQFRSRVTCCNCGRLSDTIENTNTWPVDVKYVQDLRKGLLHFLREEVLDGQNAYKCDKCNKKTRATKKYSIRTAPNILVVHLKRFDFSYAGKLSHFVTYPETLSLRTLIPDTTIPQLAGSASNNHNDKALRNVNYKLYGVLVHLGNTSHSGHYYSYVRGPSDVWYKADDQRVNTVQSKDALSQKAYILFYMRTPPSATPVEPAQPILHHNKLLASATSSTLAQPKPTASNGHMTNGFAKPSTGNQPQVNGHASNGTNGIAVSEEKPEKVDGEKPEMSAIEAKAERIRLKMAKKLKKKELKRLKKKKLKNSLKKKKESIETEPEPVEEKDEHVNGTDNQEENGVEEDAPEKKVKKVMSEKKRERLRLKKLLKQEKKIKRLNKKKLLKAKRSEKSDSESENAAKPVADIIECNSVKPMEAPSSFWSKGSAMKPFAEENKVSVLDELKAKLTNGLVKTWENKASSVLLASKKEERDDDYEEYNEEFDQPLIREKNSNSKFLKKNQLENGFHKFTHGSRFENGGLSKPEKRYTFNNKNKFQNHDRNNRFDKQHHKKPYSYNQN